MSVHFTLFLSQYALAVHAVVYLFRKMDLLTIRRLGWLYAFLSGAACYYSELLAYKFLVTKVNSVIYGFDAALMGAGGVFEEFFLVWIFMLPVLALLTLAFRAEYRGRRRLAAFILAVYVTVFVVHRVVIELWAPGLVNYG